MPTPQWLQHPFIVFALPLIVLLCAPHAYKLLPASTNPSYDEIRLQRIADLMTDIYGTLSNSTYIPFNAVHPGLHHIDTTALPCKPSASVLRLMALLPYVDSALVDQSDWIYGGAFMDYRNPEHLAELCDPLRGRGIGWTDYMAPSDIALTNWGTGGWNNDRTWVMIYNTERDSIRIFDAEDWLHRSLAQDEFGQEMSASWFEDHGEFMWDRPHGAAPMLRAIANNYRSLKWIPWETSNRGAPDYGIEFNKNDAFDLEDDFVRDYMKHNHWPDRFHPWKFRAAVIRAKHNPRGRSFIESLEARISLLLGSQANIEEQLAHHHVTPLDISNKSEHWLHRWRTQKLEWKLDDDLAELSLLEDEKEDLCPAGVCRPIPPALWQHWNLALTYQVIEHDNRTEKCGLKFQVLDSQGQWIYGSPHDANHIPAISQYWSCVHNYNLHSYNVKLALEASTADVERQCLETLCKPLGVENAWKRAELSINVYKRDIAAAEARKAKILDFLSQIPNNAELELHEVHDSIKLLDLGLQSLTQTLNDLEILSQEPEHSSAKLHQTLEYTYELHGMTDYGIAPVAEEAFRGYQEWWWRKQVQRQSEDSEHRKRPEEEEV